VAAALALVTRFVPFVAAAPAGYVPFMQPLPVWDYWYLLAVPLCAGVSVVYKSIRCRSMRTVPREAAKATGWILLGLVAAGAALLLLVKAFEWAGS
jgi:hypothetical protein